MEKEYQINDTLVFLVSEEDNAEKASSKNLNRKSKY